MGDDIHDIPGDGWGWYAADYLAMDRAFVAAMARAIRLRLERPERIGIDKRPGTKNPTLVRPVVLPVNGSHMGDVADLGDGGLTGLARRAAPISLARRADSAKR
jgi:hypothetical protein